MGAIISVRCIPFREDEVYEIYQILDQCHPGWRFHDSYSPETNKPCRWLVANADCREYWFYQIECENQWKLSYTWLSTYLVGPSKEALRDGNV